MQIVQRLCIVIVLSAVSLFAFSDSDFDGVSDAQDLCPNTLIELLVDKDGCPKKVDFTLMIGQEHSEGNYGGSSSVTNDTTSYYLGAKHGLWSYALSSSTDKSTDATSSSSGDTYVSAAYALVSTQKRQDSVQAIVKIATANTTIGTGENDYGVKYTTTLFKRGFAVAGSLGYTVTGDSDTVKYRDIISGSVGVGAPLSSRFYISGYFNYATAYVAGVDASMNTALFGTYSLSQMWFITGSYSLGLSDAVADSAYNLSLGLTF